MANRHQIFQFALPYRQDSPPKLSESRHMPYISCPVSFYLRTPERIIRFWESAFAACVAVPETSVDKNDLLAPHEYDVGLSG